MAVHVDSTVAPEDVGGRSRGKTTAQVDWEEHVDALLQNMRRSRRKLTGALLGTFAVIGIIGLIAAWRGSQGRDPQPFASIAACTSIVLIILFVTRSESRDWYMQRVNTARKVLEVLEEERGHNEVAEESVDLDSLLRNNRSLLKTYHSISTEQAQEAFKMAKTVIAVAAAVFLLACILALRGETVIGISLAGAAVVSSGVGGWVARTFLESYRISVTQAEAYFREPMVQGYLLAAHQIAQTMETPQARDEGLSRVMDGFLAAGLECARSGGAVGAGGRSSA